MATLTITLPQAALQASTPVDYVLTPDGVTVGVASNAPLALLPGAGHTGSTTPHGRLTDTVLLVSAARLSWHRVQLPQGAGNGPERLRAILVGVLEDQLLDEAQTLHFALEPGGAKSASTWVAVCDKAWLHSGLMALDDAGIAITRIVPELLPDTSPEGLYAVQESGQALLLHASANGVRAWPLQATTVAALGAHEKLPLYAEPAVAILAEHILGRSAMLQNRAERALLASQNSWDLAQFDLVSTQRSRSFKRLGAAWRELMQAPSWRAARWSLLALVAVNLVGLHVRAAVERAGLQAQRQAIAAVWTHTFPTTQVVVDAPVQMQRAVAALQQGAGALGTRDFETLLGAWSQAAPGAPAPAGLDFANGELRLRGLSVPADTLAQATRALQGQGYGLTPSGDDLLLRAR